MQKLTGRKNWEGNVQKQQGWPQVWEYCQAKPIQTWESFTMSKLESVYQESLRSDIFRKRATKPLLNQKHRQKHLTWEKEKKNWLLLSGPKSSFQMNVHFAFYLEIKVLEEEWRGTKSMLLEVQCVVFTVSDDLVCHLLVLVHCVSWSPQSTQPSIRRF